MPEISSANLLESREVLIEKRERLLKRLRFLESEEKRLEKELEKAKEQVEYYRGLLKDMKTDLSPSFIGKLLDMLGGR